MARAIPPSLVSDPLICQCFFKDCFVLDTSDSTWQQVQLSIRYSSFCLWSVCSSGFGDRDTCTQYVVQPITLCTSQVILSDDLAGLLAELSCIHVINY